MSYALEKSEEHYRSIFARVAVIPGTGKSLGSFINITPMVMAQQKIKENESKLKVILEAFEGFVYTCSNNYRLLYMNKSLSKFAGKIHSDKNCYKIIFDIATPCHWCPIPKVFNGETIKQEFLWKRTGRWYYAVSSPIFDSNKQVVKMQSVIIDIHERKQAEIEIKTREKYLHKENARLRSTIKDRYKFCNIVGRSQPMQKVYESILKASVTNANVIIYGESGTGKELVARAIHDMSDRSHKTFVPVNSGAIPSNLMESEFFGFKKGAFTGALHDTPGYLDHAEKGTLFLDELGEIDLNIQVKLLRIIEGLGYMPVGGREEKKQISELFLPPIAISTILLKKV